MTWRKWKTTSTLENPQLSNMMLQFPKMLAGIKTVQHLKLSCGSIVFSSFVPFFLSIWLPISKVIPHFRTFAKVKKLLVDMFLHLKTQREIIYRIHFRMKKLKMVANIFEVAWKKSEFPELHFSVSQKQASTSKPLTLSCLWQPKKNMETIE